MRSHSFLPQQRARSLKAKFFARVRFRISRSGTRRTKYKRGETSKRCTVAPRERRLGRRRNRRLGSRHSCTTVKPPKVAGAALSGCPSTSAHNRNTVSRSSGSPLSRFSASRMPRRTVALLPRPRHRGTPFRNRTRKRERTPPRLLEKSFCSVRHNSWMRRSRHLAADDRDAVMKAERDAQTIVARTEIGSARRNTNCNLLHSYDVATRAVDPTARK